MVGKRHTVGSINNEEDTKELFSTWKTHFEISNNMVAYFAKWKFSPLV